MKRVAIKRGMERIAIRGQLILSAALVCCGAASLRGAELPASCHAPVPLTEALRSKLSASVYDAAGAWFAEHDNAECALAAFKEAVRLEPHSAEAHYDLGVELARAEKPTAAVSEFRLALNNDPQLSAARGALGAVLLDVGRPAEAEAELREALKADPKSVFVLDHLAQALSAQRRYDAAVRYWSEAVAQQPGSPDLRLALGTAAYENAAAKQALGTVSAQDAGTNDAIRILSELTQSNPNMKTAHFTLGNIYAREGRFREAADEYAAVTRLDPSDAVALLAGVKALVTASAYQEALPSAQEYVKRMAGDPEGHLLLGSVYKGLGEYPKAEGELERAVAGNPNEFESQYQLGFVLARNNKTREALDHLQKAVALKPSDSSAQFQLAAVLRTQGDSAESNQVTEEFKKSKERDFKVSQLAAKGNQANQYLRAGDPVHAAEVYRQMLQIDPENARTEYNLALALQAGGDMKGARGALEKAASLDPRMALARSELGGMDLAAGHVASAQKWLESAIVLDPQLVAALGNLGVIYAMQGDNVKAEAVFRRAVEDDPRYTQGHLNLGLVLAQQQRYAEAEGELDKALELKPNDLRTLSAIGKVKCRLGKSRDGVAILGRVVSLAPDSAGAHLDLAIALASSYDLPGALVQTDEAVRLAPDAAAVHLNRGTLLFDLGRPAEARREFETASELAPEMPEPHYYLGLIEKQAGNYAAAIPHLETAAKYQPRSVMTWQLLGQCLDSESRRTDAINAWRQALAIDPEYTQTLWSLGHAFKTTDPEMSARLLQKFDEIQKKNKILDRAGTLNNDALALMQQSDWPAAIGKLKEAIRICTNCAGGQDLHKNLGLAYCHAGNIEAGEKELHLAEAAKAGDPEVQRVLTLIAQVHSKGTQPEARQQDR